MSGQDSIKLYQPSNGTEGMGFVECWCEKCVKFPLSSDAKNQCSIFCATLMYDTNDSRYPNQWRYVDGKPVCTAFKSREEYNAERRKKGRAPSRDKNTDDLFASQQAIRQGR